MEQKKETMTWGFYSFLATQGLGAFNDNAFKISIAMMILAILPKANGGAAMVSLSSALFILPFLLFSSWSGLISDHYSKKKVILWTKVFEMAVMSLAVIGFTLSSLPFLLFCLFLMGLQSTLFSPAKYGIMPELLKDERLSQGNGLLEASTFLAIILGTAAGGVIIPWSGGGNFISGMFFVFIALTGILFSFGIPFVPSAKREIRFEKNPFGEVFRTFQSLKGQPHLIASIVGLVYFWGLGAFLQMNLLLFAKYEMLISETQTGIILTALALGIGIGSLAAGRLSGEKVEIGLVPFGALGTALFLFLMPFAVDYFQVILPEIFFLGFFAGFMVVPLQAAVQKDAEAEKRGSILSALNFATFSAILFSSFLFWVLSDILHISSAHILTLTGLFTLIMGIGICVWQKKFFIRFVFWIFAHSIYRIRIIGRDHIPQHGPALLISNHVSLADALLIGGCVQRFIRFVMWKKYYDIPILRHFCGIMMTIPIDPEGSWKDLRASLYKASEELKNEKVVCLFAEGQITRTGNLLKFQRGLEMIAKKAKAPIVPVHLDNVWGSLFSYERGKFFWKIPRALPYPITVTFGHAMPYRSSAAQVRRAVMELGAQAFPFRPFLHETLLDGFLRSVQKRFFYNAITDSMGASLSFGKTAAAAFLLSKKLSFLYSSPSSSPPGGLKKRCIGIVLPPSAAGALANLAAEFMGFIPVNLNFTAPNEALSSAIDKCAITRIVTSRIFLKKIKVKLPGELVYIEDIMKEITRFESLKAYLFFLLTPSILQRKLFHKKNESATDVATILFSSGSTGDPKGVMLTHQNIRSNIAGLSQVFDIHSQDRMAGILPFFHSFGMTATLWLPLVAGFGVSFHPNPLNAKGVGKLVEKNKCTILLATPTFCSMYLKKVNPEQFSSLRFAIVGAEKLRVETATAFENKFSCKILEGYGATELSPIAAVNIPNFSSTGMKQPGSKAETVGQPLPGVPIRIADAENGLDLEPGKEGILWVSGPGVMKGYLNDAKKTEEVIQDGWYNTGDIAEMDDEGFIKLKGRLSRFSKIAGEMVPHERIEEILLEGEEERNLAVTGTPDTQKGEKLVVLYTGEIEIENLRKRLKERGLTNLWIPKAEDFIPVPSIPQLGTGKLDLREIQNIAMVRNRQD